MRKTVEIQSIFDGFSPSRLFGQAGQYSMAIGIDPDVPLTDDSSDVKTGGWIRPVKYASFSSTEIDAAPIEIFTTPKSDLTWVVLSNGKIIAYETDLTSANSHSIGQVTGSIARGGFYYNNYIYITGTGSAHDDMSRIGPLNTVPYDTQTVNFTVGLVVTGTNSGATGRIVSDTDGGATGVLVLDQISGIFLDNETITDSSTGSATVNRTFASLITNNVWKGATLGSQDPLTDSAYPVTLFNIGYLNHFGFVHSDGVAYVLDYDGAKGYIHKIQTTKGTYQGDTNDGSAFATIDGFNMPLDMVPITACSRGIDVVIAATYTTSTDINQGQAFLLFWNGTDDLFDQKVPLPYPICSTLWYVNGVLYGHAGSLSGGYCLFRYVGGDAVEVLKIIEDGFPPLQNAISGVGSRVVWGANTTLPIVSSGLLAYGSKSNLFPQGLHHIAVSDFT